MVKLHLNLYSMSSCNQENLKFNSSFKAFLYKQFENSEFSLDKVPGFKYFTYSNLFLIENQTIEENRFYSVIISSPKPDLILYLMEKLSSFQGFYNKEGKFCCKNEQDSIIHLGEGKFCIENFMPKREEIHSNLTLESISPICVKESIENGKSRFVNFDTNSKKFKELLAKNLIKKYNFLTNSQENLDLNLFENIKIKPIYRKSGNSFYKIDIYKENLKDNLLFIMGHRLKFEFGSVSDLQVKIFQVGLDSGFGSMNSYGMGYIRIVGGLKND